MDRWQRLQTLFEQALVLAPERRQDFLRECEPDSELRARVLDLLRSDADADGEDALDALVHRAAGALAPAAITTGLRVGAWRLIDELGAGGMGTVFRAERADGAYQHTVAIKFLRGIPTREGAERMFRERQILADLQHPGIAGLIDGGNTDEGQPYLVMEHVDGVPITDYARGRPLEQRLRLVQQVARAVHYAHQRLVIHRDLKPANVLVGSDGTPVLLDFGIAKLLDEDGTAPGVTRAWYTPGYASPEQRRGEAVSTATDIYALGQLLAEVLGGDHLPPDSRGRVPLPSARSIAGISRRRLRELDAIVAHACASRPGERYPSAEALATDIDRYFLHQPLRAAPARPFYLVGKFLRRQRFVVAAALVLLIALSTFTWRLAIERDRALRAERLAQQESATAERVVDYLVSLFDAASPEQAGHEPIQPHELIDRGRERIAEQLADHPWQHARLLAVLATIDTRLGRSELAMGSLRQAISIEREQGDDPQRLARHLVELAVLENQNERPAQAVEAASEALHHLDRHRGDALVRVEALATLALAQSRLGQVESAQKNMSQAAALLSQDVGQGVVDLRISTLHVQTEILSRTGALEQALAPAAQALALARQTADPYTVATSLGFLANAHVALEQYEPAEALFREMLELRLRSLHPGSAWVVTVRNNLAQTIYARGRVLEALPLMQENVDHLRARGEVQTPSYAVALNNLASLHEMTANYALSVPLFQEALELAELAGQVSGGNDPRLAMYRQNLGRSLMLAGRHDQAWPLLSAEIEGGAEAAADSLVIERGRRALHLGEWLRRARRLDEVAVHLDQAEQLFLSVLPAGHPRQAAVLRARGLLALDLGDANAAEATLRQAMDIYVQVLGAESHAAMETRAQLADVLQRLGRRREAQDLLIGSRAIAKRLYVPDASIHSELDRLAPIRDETGQEIPLPGPG